MKLKLFSKKKFVAKVCKTTFEKIRIFVIEPKSKVL